MRYRDQRFPSDILLRVEHGDQVHRAQVANVSTTGARLRHLDPLAPETRVTLCFLHLRFPAQVAWAKDQEIGVQFVIALSAPDLTMFRGASGGRAAGWGGSYGAFRELG